MDLKDYINKNLPNLNWNLLPQIFEENEVELTDEIKAYLKETPENTNWNILNGMSGGGGNILLYEADHSFSETPGGYLFSSKLTPKEQIYDNLMEGNQVRVSIGTNISTGIITEGKSDDGYEVLKYFNLNAPFTEDCRISWDEYGQNPKAYIYLYLYDEPGTYHVKIEKI